MGIVSPRQELHAAHAVLELILDIRLINSIITIYVHCFMLSFLYSRCVLSAFLINEYCIVLPWDRPILEVTWI